MVDEPNSKRNRDALNNAANGKLIFFPRRPKIVAQTDKYMRAKNVESPISAPLSFPVFRKTMNMTGDLSEMLQSVPRPTLKPVNSSKSRVPERLRTIPPLVRGKKRKKSYREYYGNTFGPASECRRPEEDQIAAIAVRYGCIPVNEYGAAHQEAAAGFIPSKTTSSKVNRTSRDERKLNRRPNLHTGVNGVKSAYLNLYDEAGYQVAFTGTLKQMKLHRIAGSFHSKEFLNNDLAADNLGLFMTEASRELLGKRAVRGGRQLSCAAVIEGNSRSSETGEPRIHIHGSIGGLPDGGFDLSSPTNMRRLERLLARIWRNTPWGYSQFKIELLSKATWELDDKEFTADGWRNYIFKDIHAGNAERVIIRNQYLN